MTATVVSVIFTTGAGVGCAAGALFGVGVTEGFAAGREVPRRGDWASEMLSGIDNASAINRIRSSLIKKVSVAGSSIGAMICESNSFGKSLQYRLQAAVSANRRRLKAELSNSPSNSASVH